MVHDVPRRQPGCWPPQKTELARRRTAKKTRTCRQSDAFGPPVHEDDKERRFFTAAKFELTLCAAPGPVIFRNVHFLERVPCRSRLGVSGARLRRKKIAQEIDVAA